jgi:hypothetical protein
MISSQITNEMKFTSPAYYRIHVKGFLDESWSDRLNGLSINNLTSPTGSPIAELCGKVRDQAELLGVLGSIYEMHLPLLSVEVVDDEPAGHPGAAPTRHICPFSR